jgi:hypothetical protein
MASHGSCLTTMYEIHLLQSEERNERNIVKSYLKYWKERAVAYFKVLFLNLSYRN